jgi:ubiquinone/menaquinone biosynthesis C-methylase UbiE
MNQQGSYQIQTITSNVDLEIKRLKAQVELFWDKEIKHYVEFGLTDGMSIVELGSGPGFVTEKIIQRFPNTKITAVEIDPLLVEYAKNYLAEKQFHQCTVIQKSIIETGLPENLFDFAITRLLLEHLPDPVGAIGEVFRILKPGGKIVVVDNDFEIHIMTYPHVSELRELYDAYCQARYAEGGNPKIGRELPNLLKQGGFSKVDFEIICAHSDILGDQIFLNSEGIGIPTQLVRDGFLPSKMLAKISYDWRNMLKNECHSIIRQLCMASGEK